jgi:hypothetical protein
MTDLKDPSKAELFTVGKNQRNGFRPGDVGSHEHYMGSLFNRGTESCRDLYDRIVGSPSPTRLNTDNLVKKLKAEGVTQILETNVICYSTDMSADLRKKAHLGGAAKGQQIFTALMELIRPKVIIAHGVDTSRRLAKHLGSHLPLPPLEPTEPVWSKVGETAICCIPSLAPPNFNLWSRWADSYLSEVARTAAEKLKHS